MLNSNPLAKAQSSSECTLGSAIACTAACGSTLAHPVVAAGCVANPAGCTIAVGVCTVVCTYETTKIACDKAPDKFKPINCPSGMTPAGNICVADPTCASGKLNTQTGQCESSVGPNLCSSPNFSVDSITNPTVCYLQPICHEGNYDSISGQCATPQYNFCLDQPMSSCR